MTPLPSLARRLNCIMPCEFTTPHDMYTPDQPTRRDNGKLRYTRSRCSKTRHHRMCGRDNKGLRWYFQDVAVARINHEKRCYAHRRREQRGGRGQGLLDSAVTCGHFNSGNWMWFSRGWRLARDREYVCAIKLRIISIIDPYESPEREDQIFSFSERFTILTKIM